MSKVLVLPGDGIGQEIIAQALKVVDYLTITTIWVWNWSTV